MNKVKTCAGRKHLKKKQTSCSFAALAMVIDHLPLEFPFIYVILCFCHFCTECERAGERLIRSMTMTILSAQIVLVHFHVPTVFYAVPFVLRRGRLLLCSCCCCFACLKYLLHFKSLAYKYLWYFILRMSNVVCNVNKSASWFLHGYTTVRSSGRGDNQQWVQHSLWFISKN